MRLAVLFALLALSACDSGGSAPPPVVPPPVLPPPVVPPPSLLSFTLPEVPARLTYEATERASLTPISFFGASQAPTGTYFRAASTGPGVRVATTSTTLTIEALTVGVTPITVTLKASGYRDSTVTIPVEVVPGVCPPAAPAGSRDYFPVQGGTVWTFGYGYTEFVGNPVDIINGTLTLTFGQPRCIRGMRTWPVVQRLVGTRRPSNSPSTPPVPYTAEAQLDVTESPAHQIEFQIALPQGLPHTATLDRYADATGRVTLEPYTATNCPAPSGYPPSTMTFTSGVGLSSESMHCATPTGTLTRFMSRP